MFWQKSGDNLAARVEKKKVRQYFIVIFGFSLLVFFVGFVQAWPNAITLICSSSQARPPSSPFLFFFLSLSLFVAFVLRQGKKITHDLEVFFLSKKDVPFEHIGLDFEVISVAWEPVGTKVCLM